MERDFTYIDDIVEGVVRVTHHPAEPNPDWNSAHPDPSSSRAPYRIYNIGNNNPVKLMDVIAALENALGKKAEKRFLPMQPGDVPATYANIDSLARDFDYRPATSITEGVGRFVDWYLRYKKQAG
jgi:UDP-glucuronate 4-epimerase